MHLHFHRVVDFLQPPQISGVAADVRIVFLLTAQRYWATKSSDLATLSRTKLLSKRNFAPTRITGLLYRFETCRLHLLLFRKSYSRFLGRS